MNKVLCSKESTNPCLLRKKTQAEEHLLFNVQDGTWKDSKQAVEKGPRVGSDTEFNMDTQLQHNTK